MSMNVLVVDDNADIREVLEIVLTSHGHAVRTAHDSGEAAAIADQSPPDVVLLDYRMPGDQRVQEFVNTMRRGGATRVVLMSGIGDVAQRATQMGLRYSLQKPFDVAKLIEVVERPG